MLTYADHSGEYFKSLDAQIEKLKEEAVQAARQKEKEVDSTNEEYSRQKRELRENLDSQTVLARKLLLESAIDNPFLHALNNPDRDDSYISPRPSADDILAQAETRYSHEILLVGRRTVVRVFPQYVAWQSKDPAKFGNVLVTYAGVANTVYAVNLVNNMVIRMLMAFSPGCLNLTFIDPFSTGNANLFIKRLAASPSVFYNIAMTERAEIEGQLKSLKAKMQKAQESLPVNCRSVVERNERECAIATPYEVVVIYDSHRLGMHEHLFPLIENGNKSGIYLILMQPETDGRQENHDMARLLNSERFNAIRIDENSQHQCERPQKQAFRGLEDPMAEKTEDLLGVNIANPPAFIDEYFRKFAETIEEKEKARKSAFTYNRDLFHRESYENAFEGFSIPVGTLPDGSEFNFALNNKEHTHTLIIGKTGSGKTTLLHDILTTATLKYSPASLHLYLYDLKSGLEFSRYKGVPHVIANIAAEEELATLVEPLKGILAEIEARNNKIKREGLSELFDYNNSKADDKDKLPIILLVIDEGRYLFEGKGAIQESINAIMLKIARQGRSYGVYLILSSQTIGTALPADLKSQITEKFILKSELTDAGQIIDTRHIDKIARINRLGQTIYCCGDDFKDLQPYYFIGEKSNELKRWLNIGKEKATRHGYTAQTVIYDSEDRPELEKQDLSQTKAMVLGRSIGMKQEPASLPINKRESGNNLLIVGNQETHEGDAEMNAVRIIVSSLITLKQHYKNSQKPYKIFIINKLDDESDGYNTINLFDGAEHISFLSNRQQVEKALMQLYQKAGGGQNELEKEDVYLFILGQHRFRDMREETIKMPANAATPSTGDDAAAAGSYWIKEMDEPQHVKEVSYIAAIGKILSDGPENGIHTIIQVNRIGNLLFGNYNFSGNTLNRLLYRFKYRAILSMNSQDFANVAGDGKDGSVLSSDPDKTRVYFFDEEKENALTLFTPFVIPGIEYIERYLNQ